jgi:hypothetical protein
LGGSAERRSGRLTPTKNDFAGVTVVWLPTVDTVPPPVAMTLVLAPQLSVGIEDGVTTIGFGDVVVGGATVPSVLWSVAVTL